MADITTAIRDGLNDGDDSAVKELIEDVSKDVLTLITSKFGDGEAEAINAIRAN